MAKQSDRRARDTWDALTSLEYLDDAPIPVFATLLPDRRTTLRRLNITDALADAFLQLIVNELARLKGAVSQVPLAYVPDYKPDDHEVEYFELAGTPLESIVESFQSEEPIPLVDSKGQFYRSARFSVLVVDSPLGQLRLFRKVTSRSLAKRGRVNVALFQDQYDLLESPPYQFDSTFDAIAVGDFIFSIDKRNFQNLFRFYEHLVKDAKESLQDIRAAIPIANFDDFKSACLRDTRMMGRLQAIAARGDLARFTIPVIKRLIKDYGLVIEIKKEDGKERLLFAGARRWDILNLLADRHVTSPVTHKKYEANSVREVMGGK